MSITYTISTNFGAKDALADSNPAKVIVGSEFTTEFNAIKTALASAASTVSPTFTGTVTADGFTGAFTATAGTDAGGFIISNVGAPVASTDASTKAYVDAKLLAEGQSLDNVVAVGDTTALDITAGNLTATSAVSGATVAATGAVSGASVAATGGVSGASVTATGGVSGASVTATGSLVVDGSVEEQTYNLAQGTSLDPANGTVQYTTLTGNKTYTSALTDGEYITLAIDPATFSVTWPTISWAGGVAPTLIDAQDNIITLWSVNSTIYGVYSGAA